MTGPVGDVVEPDRSEHDRAARPLLATAFRVAALVEATTWAGLLVGMAFKYVWGDDDLGVRVFGPLHGAAFVAYVVATLAVAWRFGWSWRLVTAGLLASIPPVLTWPFERYVTRRGRLDVETLSPGPRPNQ